MIFIQGVLLMVVSIIALGFVLIPKAMLPVGQCANGIQQPFDKCEIVRRRNIHEFEDS